MLYTYAEVVKMTLPQFNISNKLGPRDSILTMDSGISSIISVLSEPCSLYVIPSDFSENWADSTKMDEFLSNAGGDENSQETFQNIVNQVTEDWTDIYMVTSFKGIGSDASRWICVKTCSGRYVYQRRPSRRKAREENAIFYRSIVLNVDGDILEIV